MSSNTCAAWRFVRWRLSMPLSIVYAYSDTRRSPPIGYNAGMKLQFSLAKLLAWVTVLAVVSALCKHFGAVNVLFVTGVAEVIAVTVLAIHLACDLPRFFRARRQAARKATRAHMQRVVQFLWRDSF